jgi:hypothetical protein
MKTTAIIVLAILAAAISCIAGCTSPTQSGLPPLETPQVTTPTATSLAPTTTQPGSLTPLPSEQFVDIEVYKERPDATIHLVYNGGKGEVFIQRVMMRITRADGTVSEQYLNNNERKPRRGDELILQGTRGTDRAEVFVTSAGAVYKTYDSPLAVPYYP